MEFGKFVNSRLAIEETILYFNPDISDVELLNLRESIYYDVWSKTPANTYNATSFYARDYYLYSRKKYV